MKTTGGNNPKNNRMNEHHSQLPSLLPQKRGVAGWLPIVVAGVLMVGYDVSPVDLVPDLIPVVGLLDDAALTVAALAYMVYKYRKLKS